MLDAIDAAPPRSVVIAGPAGAGKTRLAGEALHRRGADGGTVRHVVATRAGAGYPYVVLAGLLGAETTPSTPLDAIRVARRALPGDGLLVVDDVQWLDEASAVVVHGLVTDGWCTLLATLRTGETAPDPVLALWKDGWADRLDLGPLDEQALAAMAETAAGGPVDGHVVKVLQQVSGGNALYAREWLLAALDSGALQPVHGVWLLKKHPEAPPRLVELVIGRVSVLAPPEREVLELVAVAQQLPLHVATARHDPAAVEALEVAGFVVVDGEGDAATVRPAHPLVGESLRVSMGTARAARVLRVLADDLSATGTGSAREALQVVRWRLDAGVALPAEELLDAARAAMSVGDVTGAGRLARAARAAGAGWDVELLEGDIAILSARPADAEQVLATALASADSEDRRVAAAFARAYNLAAQLDRYGDAAGILDEVAADLAPDDRVAFEARTAMVHVMAGHPLLGRTRALPAVDDERVGGNASYAAALASALLGRRDEVEVHVARFLRTVRGRPLNRLPESVLPYRAMARTDAGDLAGGLQDARDAYDTAVRAGDREGQATASLVLGRLALVTGRVSDALAHQREATAVNRELGDVTALRWTLGGLGLSYAMAGDVEAADEVVAELAGTPAHLPTLEAELALRAGAWAAAARGELSVARSLLEQAAEHASRHDQRAAEVVLRHDLVRLGTSAAQSERLAELAGLVDGPLPRLRAEHARVAAEGDAAGLEGVAQRLEELGLLLDAAEALTAAGRRWRSEGERRRAAAATARAAALATRCPGARTPGLLLPDEPVPLTAREREIAVLAARGRASKEIASALYLSPRTVDNHLQRVYAKLGVSGREGLAALLGV